MSIQSALDEFNKQHGTHYGYVLNVPLELEGARELWNVVTDHLHKLADVASRAAQVVAEISGGLNGSANLP
jgi:hypothetical protein